MGAVGIPTQELELQSFWSPVLLSELAGLTLLCLSPALPGFTEGSGAAP